MIDQDVQHGVSQVPYRSVIPPSAQEIDILNQLVKVMTMQTRVFLVHMTVSLGSRLFLQAKKAGMLNDETVWIVTDGLTSLLDPIEYRVVKSMQGVIGVRPHLHRSNRLERLKKKLRIGKIRDHLISACRSIKTSLSSPKPILLEIFSGNSDFSSLSPG